MKQLERFTSRVGKTIYRKAVDCTCSSCVDGCNQGVYVFNANHAQYLHTVHCEMGIEYYDTPLLDNVEQLKDMFGI